jgi:hypothetical protein
VGNRPYRLQGIADEIYEKKFPGQKPPNEVGEAGDRHYHLSFVAINAQPLEKVKLATLPDSYSSAQS